jgi:type II secretory pathway pseudopilin PulG
VLVDVLAILSVVAAFACVGWLIFVQWRGDDRMRAEEEAARAYFDEHGRWPDEDGDGGR